MENQATDYQRLSSRFRSRVGFNRGSLWLAPDHLLKIRIHGLPVLFDFNEFYRRFYLKDIKAMAGKA